ncbi:MAG: hypothetical protein RI973_607 [Bacteroidota bacterium]|jgi:hypothetical protein
MRNLLISVLTICSLVFSLSASGQPQRKGSLTNYNEVLSNEFSEVGDFPPVQNAGILLIPVDSTPPMLRNAALYGTIGASVIGFVAGNIEFMVAQKPKGFFKAYSLRVGFGVQENFGGEGGILIGALNMLTGRKNSHFEVGLGWNLLFDEASLPLIAAGYRFQKPRGRFVFRTGVGLIEGVYVSLGTAF